MVGFVGTIRNIKLLQVYKPNHAGAGKFMSRMANAEWNRVRYFYGPFHTPKRKGVWVLWVVWVVAVAVAVGVWG